MGRNVWCLTIRTAPANSAEFRGIRPRMCIEDLLYNAGGNVTLTLYNVSLTSQKPFKHNNKCDCSIKTGFNGVYVLFNKISL